MRFPTGHVWSRRASDNDHRTAFLFCYIPFCGPKMARDCVLVNPFWLTGDLRGMENTYRVWCGYGGREYERLMQLLLLTSPRSPFKPISRGLLNFIPILSEFYMVSQISAAIKTPVSGPVQSLAAPQRGSRTFTFDLAISRTSPRDAV